MQRDSKSCRPPGEGLIQWFSGTMKVPFGLPSGKIRLNQLKYNHPLPPWAESLLVKG